MISNPTLHSKGRFLYYEAWLRAERQPSYKERLRESIGDVLAKGPDSFDAFLRLVAVRSHSLCWGSSRPPGSVQPPSGKGFDPGEIQNVIAGKRPLPKLDAPAPAALRRVDLIVDIQERLRSV